MFLFFYRFKFRSHTLFGNFTLVHNQFFVPFIFFFRKISAFNSKTQCNLRRPKRKSHNTQISILNFWLCFRRFVFVSILQNALEYLCFKCCLRFFLLLLFFVKQDSFVFFRLVFSLLLLLLEFLSATEWKKQIISGKISNKISFHTVFPTLLLCSTHQIKKKSLSFFPSFRSSLSVNMCSGLLLSLRTSLAF